MKALKKADIKQYKLIMWLHMLFLQHLVDTAIVFLCIYFGTDAISLAINNIPQWILHGLSAAGGMLVVVGLGLTTLAIYQKNTVVYVLLGFILAKFVGLSTTVIAILGFIIAYITFERDSKTLATNKVSNNAVADDGQGDDSFYE